MICLLPVVWTKNCEEGYCTNSDVCVNEYNNQTKTFKRDYWNLQKVPCDIPAEAEHVYLRNNWISVLAPNTFSNLSQCQLVTVGHNEIVTIKEFAFNGMNNLLDLHMSYNKILRLSQGMWNGLGKLQKLYIHVNQVSRISSGSFQGLSSLQMLHLANNPLVFLEKGAFTGLESLTELDLHGNRLPSLDQTTFTMLPRPLILHLGRPDTQWNRLYNCSSLCWIKSKAP